MKILIQSLKRLYAKGLITDADLGKLLEDGKIDQESYDLIRHPESEQ